MPVACVNGVDIACDEVNGNDRGDDGEAVVLIAAEGCGTAVGGLVGGCGADVGRGEATAW